MYVLYAFDLLLIYLRSTIFSSFLHLYFFSLNFLSIYIAIILFLII